MRPILMGLVAVLEENLAHPNRALSLRTATALKALVVLMTLLKPRVTT